MSKIVAGRFERVIDANAAVAALKQDGFADTEVEMFYVAPPGQHARYPIGGDAHSDAGARFGSWGAVLGGAIGAVAGLALGTLLSMGHGVIAVLLLTGLGAYVGSFIGAMAHMRDHRAVPGDSEHPVETPAGTMIAVNVDRPGMLDRAVGDLRGHGAREVGATQGLWANGSWRDFDPRAPLGAI
jgi:hypothetical protein